MDRLSRKYGYYEYFYLFVMVIFMAQISGEIRQISFSFANPLPFFILLILTIILLSRNRISFNNRWFKIILYAFSCWFIAFSFKMLLFGGEYWPLGVANLAVTIIYAYIHAAVFGKDLFIIFEKIMVWLSVISLIFYTFQLLVPTIANSFFSMFPDTKEGGYNFLYLYKYFYIISDRTFYIGLTRNSGCSWEPGRFSVMLIFAMYVNFLRYGKITLNKNFIILSIALLTTFSTTGYVLFLVLWLIFSVRRVSLYRALFVIVFFIPVSYYIYNIDFVSTKIEEQIETSNDINTFIHYKSYRDDNEEIMAMERFPSIGIEYENWLKDPIIGYGHWGNSWFHNNVTKSSTTCGGLMQVISTYGIILGVFFYICLFVSSRNISKLFGGYSSSLGLFLITLLASISYPVFGIIFFTSIWFAGLFLNKTNN